MSAASPLPPDRRMRILFGSFASTMPGGIPIAERPFHRALGATGHVDVSVMPFGRRRPDESRFSRYWTRALDLVRYATAIARRRQDLVHLDTAFNRRALIRDFGYVVLSLALDQRLFLKMHGTWSPLLRTRSPLLRPLMFVVLRGATGVGVLSTEERDLFVAAGFDVDRLHVVPNSVDGTRFESATWPRPGPARLLFIARMVDGKGLPDVIEAMGMLRRDGRDVTLACVGDGPARAAAEARSHALGIADAVTFTGLVPEAEATRHYLESTLLVFPTLRESFSMTIFQSLAAGLPIVTTRIRAAADHLREPDHCLWVPPGDPACLAERIGWLLDRPEVLASMSRTNLECAKRFRPEPVAAFYLDLYRRLARPEPAPRGAARRAAT